MKPSQALRAFWERRRAPDEWALVARGTSHSFLLQGVGLGLGYAVHIALARWLGAAEYGIYTYVLAWTALLSIPAGLGLPWLVVRFVPEYRVAESWGLLRGLLGWGWRWIALAGLALALAGVAIVLSSEVRQGVYAVPLLVGLWLIPLQAFMRYAAGIFRAFHRLGRAYALPVLRHTLVLALVFLVVLDRQALTSVQALAVTIGAVALVLVAQAPGLLRLRPDAVRCAQAVYEARGWLQVSLLLLLGSGFSLLLNETDILMVGTLLGPREAGIYRAASKTAQLAAFVLAAVAAAAAPVIATLHAQGNLQKLQRLLSVLAHWIFWPSLALVLVLALAAVPVLRFFGPGFEAGRWALLILAAGQLVLAGMGLSISLLSMTGHHGWVASVLGWCVLLNLMLNAACILWLGLVGAALATAVALIITAVAFCLVARRRLRVDPSIIFALWGKALQ